MDDVRAAGTRASGKKLEEFCRWFFRYGSGKTGAQLQQVKKSQFAGNIEMPELDAPELDECNGVAWEAWQWLCGTANPTVPISEIEAYCRVRGLMDVWDITQKLMIIAGVRSEIGAGTGTGRK